MLPLTAKQIAINRGGRKNRGKIRKKEDKSGRRGKNQEVSFTFILLTDRAGYATANCHDCKHFQGFKIARFELKVTIPYDLWK